MIPPRLQVTLLSLYHFLHVRMLNLKTYHTEDKMTTCSYIYVAESQFKSVEMEVLVRKGSVSYGLEADFSLPHCLVVGQGIGLSSENHLQLA